MKFNRNFTVHTVINVNFAELPFLAIGNMKKNMGMLVKLANTSIDGVYDYRVFLTFDELKKLLKIVELDLNNIFIEFEIGNPEKNVYTVEFSFYPFIPNYNEF